jgi:hypothetical protein
MGKQVEGKAEKDRVGIRVRRKTVSIIKVKGRGTLNMTMIKMVGTMP